MIPIKDKDSVCWTIYPQLKSRIDLFISLTTAITWIKIQTGLSRIWTRIVFYGDNRGIKRASLDA